MIYFFYKVYKGKLLRVDHFIAGDEEEPARKHFIHCRKQSNFEDQQLPEDWPNLAYFSSLRTVSRSAARTSTAPWVTRTRTLESLKEKGSETGELPASASSPPPQGFTVTKRTLEGD